MSYDDLEGLSEEERAALEDEDENLTQEDDDLEDESYDDSGTEDEEQEDEQEEGAEPAPDPKPEPEARAQRDPDFVPVYQAPGVEDYEGRMAQIAEASREIAAGYEAGDFDLEEYQSRQRKLTELEWSLREANLKASLASEQQQQNLAQRWLWEQERFFNSPSNRAYREDPIVGAAFSTAVQALAADASNDSKPMAWFLEEADRITRAKLRVGPETAPQNNVRPIRGKRPNAPPTLAGVPSAAIPESGDPDEFSRLDRLNGMELESALARMSTEEADRYLMGRVA